MKIAMMATGGIGGFLAVRLGLAGHDVATIARGDHLRAIQENGLILDGPKGRETLTPWMATDDPKKVGEVDAIIFGVKGDALETAAQACLPMLGKNTVVVPLLNGVEAADRLAKFLPPENVANGAAQVSTTIASPGVIKQNGGVSRFIFAERDSKPSTRIDALRAAIDEAGSLAPATDDIERDVWQKFVLFSAVSGVTAAGRCTIGDITGNQPLGDLFQAVLKETATVGRARGVALPDDIEAIMWKFAKTLPQSLRASTAIDLEHGRPLEIDWVSGALARLASAVNEDAPINSAIYALLLPHRDGRK